ncbi:MAG: 50S ribosomal protein L9 [Candidatus Omnitrophica bacterium]|nr:50S ribosomal protein L9 [Candidatus Omnitrophota bacterium]
MMELILVKDVDKIGKSGQIIKVKEGFARNFLIPNGFAVVLTPASLKKLEQEKQSRLLVLEKAKSEFQAIKEKLEKLSLTIPVLVQEEDKMYASITAQEIAHALKEEGIELDKKIIALEEPIKSLGIYEIPVKLHPEVLAKVKVWIVKK